MFLITSEQSGNLIQLLQCWCFYGNSLAASRQRIVATFRPLLQCHLCLVGHMELVFATGKDVNCSLTSVILELEVSGLAARMQVLRGCGCRFYEPQFNGLFSSFASLKLKRHKISTKLQLQLVEFKKFGKLDLSTHLPIWFGFMRSIDISISYMTNHHMLPNQAIKHRICNSNSNNLLISEFIHRFVGVFRDSYVLRFLLKHQVQNPTIKYIYIYLTKLKHKLLKFHKYITNYSKSHFL